MFDFDTVIDRRNTHSAKWDKYKGRDVIPLWVADMDFAAPPAVIRALQERLEHGVFGYTVEPDELKAALQRSLLESHGWRVNADWILWLPGVVPAMGAVCRAIGREGDDVLTATPVYPHFLTLPSRTGRNLIAVPLQLRDGRWTFDFDRMEAAITPRTRLFLLCNPHNPVGRSYSQEELASLAEICLRRDIVICSDEVHAGLVLDSDKPHVPITMLSAEVAARTITLGAPSKTFNIAGLGCSYAIIPDPALRKQFRRAIAEVMPLVNLFGLAGALAAYREGQEWRMALLEYLRGNRDLVEREIGAMPGLSMTHVEATYLAWIDARGLKADDPVRLFEEAGVGLSDGKEFAGPGFVRLNFGCPRVLLKDALGRMRKVISR